MEQEYKEQQDQKEQKQETGSTYSRGKRKKGIRLLHVFFIVCIAMILTAVGTFFLIKYTLFGSEIKPVQLTAKEEQQLQRKLNAFENAVTVEKRMENSDKITSDTFDSEGNLEPEAYSEKGASRTIDFTEREINALLDKNSDLAEKVAVDLAENLISLRMRFPMDQDMPVLGGKILKLRAGVEVVCDEKCPVVILRGVSVMGVPVPNAWLGGIKDVDLVERFVDYSGSSNGFWQSFEEGVEKIYVQEGKLHIELKE